MRTTEEFVDLFLVELACSHPDPGSIIVLRQALVTWMKPLFEEHNAYVEVLDSMTPGTMGSYCCYMAQEVRARFNQPPPAPEKKLELPTAKTGRTVTATCSDKIISAPVKCYRCATIHLANVDCPECTGGKD